MKKQKATCEKYWKTFDIQKIKIGVFIYLLFKKKLI